MKSRKALHDAAAEASVLIDTLLEVIRHQAAERKALELPPEVVVSAELSTAMALTAAELASQCAERALSECSQ